MYVVIGRDDLGSGEHGFYFTAVVGPKDEYRQIPPAAWTKIKNYLANQAALTEQVRAELKKLFP